MASPKALHEWCRVTCASYPNVEIRNMSTSFRDGLAFCAIIHKHRPDLIDYSSLSKDNVYQNNKLAFEIAEVKLGIPALLDPNYMVSTKVPDCLSVITYLSQYYLFFNRKYHAGLLGLRSSHASVLKSVAKSKPPDHLKPCKSSTELESCSRSHSSNTGPRTACHLCFKPVHIIQRHLIEGKVFHRSCFRCNVCHSTLLPGSYTEGSDAGSLICTHHTTDNKSSHAELDQQTGSTENWPKCKIKADCFSLGGLAVNSVPHYTKKTESQDKLVCETTDVEGKENQECTRDMEDNECTVQLKNVVKEAEPRHLPSPADEDRTVEGAGEVGPSPILADGNVQQEATYTKEPSELSSPCAQVRDRSSRPVPAPRRTLGSSAVPVPAPRAKTSQTTNSCPAAGNPSNQNKCLPSSSHITIPTSGNPKVKNSHPWLGIIHPGPWTQLPPAPAPLPAPRLSHLARPWHKCKVPGPNPFAEDVDEDVKPEPADQTVHSGNAGNLSGAINTAGASSQTAGETSQTCISGVDETGNMGNLLADVTLAAAGLHVTSTESHILPRSLSVPAITSAHCQSCFSPDDMSEADGCEQVLSSQSKLVCKENPFDRKLAMPKSKTFQAVSSRRASAPGHGFPLIKRKVQTEENISTQDLRVKMRELDQQLEAMEQRGVQLEKNLRDCKNDKEEEQMLMEWFSLVHERHILVRRDTEMAYLRRQHKLEERQADVEYELRCLLNKPEGDWSQDDRGHEEQLMDELVNIIEQRNQIIGSLDQDMQREREEDMLFKAIIQNKDFQKEGLKELKKSKGRFGPSKIFKLLNHKAERAKDKKS